MLSITLKLGIESLGNFIDNYF